MSKTPRTDKALLRHFDEPVVPADFARQLELENITLQKTQKLSEDIDAPTKDEFEKVKNRYEELWVFGFETLGSLQQIAPWGESPDVSLQDEIRVGIVGIQNHVTELELKNAELKTQMSHMQYKIKKLCGALNRLLEEDVSSLKEFAP